MGDWRDELGLVLRLTASALGASALAVLMQTQSTFVIVAQCGWNGDGALLTGALNKTLKDSSLADRAAGDVWCIGDLPKPQRFGAITRIFGDPEQLWLLVALMETPLDVTTERADLLRDAANLAAIHMPRRSIPQGPMISEHHIQALSDALETLPEPIAVFDRDDRFLFWNHQFERVYAPPGVVIQAGLRFEDHLRACLAKGHVVAARGREEEWLTERLARFQACDGAHEHQLGDGRWVRVQDRRLHNGGKIGIRSDITELVDREQSIRLLFDANPVPMLVIEKETLRILSVNAAAIVFYGYSETEFLGLSIADIRPEGAPGEIKAQMEQLSDPSFASTPRVHFTSRGEKRIVRVRASSLEYKGRAAVLAAVFDATVQHRMETEVRQARAFLKDVVDNIPSPVFVKDMWDGGRYVLYNRAGETLLGRPSAEIIGLMASDLFRAEDAVRFCQQDEVALQLGAGGIVDEQMMKDADGRERWVRTRKVTLADSGGKARYVLGISEDVTEQRASEARIAHMAHHDALTGLPNRFLLHDRLDAALARVAGSSEMLAVHCIDLDGFKAVNDAWGHAVGDELLRAVVGRMRELTRPSDTASRLGGDEFVILQAPFLESDEVTWLAERLVAQLSQPYFLDGHKVEVGASIGVALAPAHGKSSDILLKRADAALYQAKRNGRRRFHITDPALDPGDPPARLLQPN